MVAINRGWMAAAAFFNLSLGVGIMAMAALYTTKMDTATSVDEPIPSLNSENSSGV